MAKEIKKVVKVQVAAGAANPAPPLGPVLGSEGISIQDFCAKFNAVTQDRRGETLPVVVTVYVDRSFDFVIKKPLAASLLKKALKIEKGSGVPNRNKVGKVTQAALLELATIKMDDLNTDSPEQGAKILAGTARSMGIDVI